MKYKVGDRVIVRKDLVGGLEYPYSNPLCGKVIFCFSNGKIPWRGVRDSSIFR